MQFDTLQDKVVVITGASSGIGKLAVEEFLREGAKVVLAARSIDEMLEHLMELNVTEERAWAVKADVSDYEQVQNIAKQALERFGKIDVWINNAAISLYGHLDELEIYEISRVIDVNLKGQVYGSKAALELFKKQGYGNLINVSSALGKGSSALQSIYVATKHAIVGFCSALREDLMSEGRKYQDISVSVLMPASMDTPLFVHAKSRLGVRPNPIPPVYHPIRAVRALVQCARHPRPEVETEGASKAMVWGFRLFPMAFEKYMGKTSARQQLSNEPKPVEGSDNFFAPMHGTQKVRGGIGTTGEHMREYAGKHPVRIGLAVAIPLFLASRLLFRARPA